MKDICVKNIPIVGRRDYSERILTDLETFDRRLQKAKELLANGYVDAPYYPAMVSLGLDNAATTDIYKINAPGYFYRLRYTGEDNKLGADDGFNPRGKTAIVMASDPKYLVNSYTEDIDNRMLYMTSTDNNKMQDGSQTTSDQGNNMYQIPCGLNTYACFTRDPDLATSLREFFFVPTILSASFGIKPDEYVIKVGQTTTNNGTGYDGINLKGNIVPADEDGLCAKIFEGDWQDNFRTMYGYHVADDSADNVLHPIKFVGNCAAEFRRKRINWLKYLGVTPSIYGYT